MYAAADFQIGHVLLTVFSNRNAILERVSWWMADFAVPEPAQWKGPTISLTLLGYGPNEPISVPLHPEAGQTFRNETATYYEHGDLWFVDFGDLGMAVVNRSLGQMTGLVHEDLFLGSSLHFEDFLHPLYELMRRHGLYPHHAAAVSLDGEGILLVGKSGQGKSTLAVDLVHRGFDYLCDDRCFVRAGEGGFEVLGFYEPFKLYPQNVGHLPGITLSESPDAKKPLDLRESYPQQAKGMSRVSGILFPSWAPEQESRLEPLPAGQALIALMPLTMVCFDSASTKAHFAFASDMVSQTPAARLVLGGDRENWHRLVREFVAGSRR